jgi:GDPmannose 4,6-dehydratase
LKALITGISGQDGHYLARELQAHGRIVTGLSRDQPRDVPVGVEVRQVDYANDLSAVLDDIRPAEIYHLASPSCIHDTLEYEAQIFAVSVTATLVMLRWIVERSPGTRFFFASSSEIFGNPVESPQSEATFPGALHPYAIAKLAGGRLCAAFRESKGVFACAGILYNHESPLRRPDFVSRRITQGVAAIACGTQSTLTLGNLGARRDWSHAADFARAFRLILEAPAAADYVLASSVSRTVEDFCRVAFAAVGLDYRNHVVADLSLFRPDVSLTRVGDISQARRALGWTPEIGFNAMVEEMVREDLARKKLVTGR